jgi:hypothetical protein
MNRQVLKISLVIAAIATMLAGCATNQAMQTQDVPQNRIQSTGVNVSGYVDGGVAKQLH